MSDLLDEEEKLRVAHALAGMSDPERVEFVGGPLTLFRSRLGRAGAAYEPLVQVPLDAAPS